MISNIIIQRFKCFENQKIEFGPLTLLVGANASGKSTVIQSLLLLRQSYQAGALNSGKLSLNGRLTTVGTAKDALYSQSPEDSIAFSLATPQEATPITFEFACPRGKRDIYTLTSNQKVHDLTINLFENRVTYLSAERLGPRLLYPMTEVWREKMNVGTQGEHTAHCLAEFGQEAIRNPKLAYPDSKNLTISGSPARSGSLNLYHLAIRIG
jgi:predicted ATPase